MLTVGIANKSSSEWLVTGSSDKEAELKCKCTGMYPCLLSLVRFLHLFLGSLTHTSLEEGVSCQRVFPPQRICRFNLGFVTLKKPFIFLLYRFFWLDCSPPPSYPYTVFFFLSFFSITSATLVAATHGEIQTAIGWSARLPDRREQGERIGSPMPGNLPDNGMWPLNNIHKYSDEAKWGCPGDCVAQAVSGMRKKEQQQHCCVGVL